MPPLVSIATVPARLLAAVRCEVAPSAVASAWAPALSSVWDFLHRHPGLRTDGHNVFLYHHPTQPCQKLICEFGVEVTREFEPEGQINPTRTPTGEAAVAIHRGPYHRLGETHAAITAWMKAQGRESAGSSWEIYGDPTPDPAATETTIYYLLR